MTSGDAASTNAARPCANHNQIIVKILRRLRHHFLPLAAGWIAMRICLYQTILSRIQPPSSR
jgi:hypothetical protein